MKTKLIILLIAFVDLLWIWIFVPILPELAKYFEVSAQSISFALVVYSFFSFIANPILWQLSDRYWRKIILFITVVWIFLSNLVISITDIFWIFLLARIVSWFVWWNVTILQSMLSDIAKNKKERMSNLWMIWAIFWLAFIIWPIFWSILINYWVKAPFIFITFLAMLSMFIIYFFLEETNTKKIKNRKIKINPIKNILWHLKNCNIRIYLISFFILMLSTSMFKWMIPLFLNEKFWVESTQVWYIMAWVWAIVFFSQMVLLKYFWLKFFNLKTLFMLVNIIIFILYISLSQMNSLVLFLWVFYILIIFTSIINPIYAWEIVDSTEESDRWWIMWVLTSLVSISMFIWPLISWTLIDYNINIFIWAVIITILNIIILPKLYRLSK